MPSNRTPRRQDAAPAGLERGRPCWIGPAGLAAWVWVAMAAGAAAAGPTLRVPSPPDPPPVTVGAPVNLSLREAVAIGLRDNRTVKSAYLARIAQHFDLVVARSAFLPKLNLLAGGGASVVDGQRGYTTYVAPTATWLTPTGAQIQFSWTQDSTHAAGDRATSETTSLTIAQPLLKGAGLDVNLAPLRIATLQEQINRLALKTTVSATVTSIVSAYRGLEQAQEQLRLAQSSLERSRTLQATTQALIDAGRVAAADLVQSQSDIASQEVNVLQAEQARNSAQTALLRLLAVDLRSNVVAADPIEADHAEIAVDKAIAVGLADRMDILAQRKSLEQQRQALVIAKNNRLWGLSAVASLVDQRGANPAVAGLSGVVQGSSRSIGLQLSIPLGDYTLRQGELDAAIAVRTSEVQLDDLRQQAEASIRDAVQGINLSWRSLQLAKQAQQLSAQALDVARAKLQAGRASSFEVLSLDASRRAADTQALTATIGYLNALTLLDQQLGTTLDTWGIDLND